MAELITQAEYARRRGVSQEAVRKAILAKRITPIPDEKGRMMIDPHVADIQWDENTDPEQAARANAPKGNSAPTNPDGGGEKSGKAYWDARTRREQTEAIRAELELKKLAGSLVDREKVQAALSRAGRMTRDALLAVPTQIAPELVDLTDAWEIERRISAALRQVLDDMSKLTVDDFKRAVES